MNRRNFLATSAAAATLAPTTAAIARPTGRLRVIVPAMTPRSSTN